MTYRKFMNHETKAVVSIHEPHPEHVLNRYQLRAIPIHLKEQGLIWKI